jgi:outer membrane phospholipase A
MKHLLLSLLVLLVFPSMRAEELRPLLQPAQPAATVGDPVSFWLNYLNPGNQPARVRVPRELHCTLTRPGTQTNISATLKQAVPADMTTVPPGGFLRLEYTFELPAGWTGEVEIASAVAAGQRLVLSVHEPPARGGAVNSGQQRRREDSSLRLTPETDPVGFFKRHFFPHEPMYFLAGTETPNAKFQISFKYKLVAVNDSDSWWETLFVGYSQTSLWDWNQPSAPFFDSSYRPEVLFSKTRLWTNSWLRLDLAGGLQHESNGRDGASSRSLNIAYLRPTLLVGDESRWFLSLSPRGWGYLGELTDNPDLADFRGYLDLRAVLGTPGGVQLSALLRAGKDFDKGSVQLDLTVPLMIKRLGSPLFLQAQYFNGYGESLLFYKQREDQFRVGLGLFR